MNFTKKTKFSKGRYEIKLEFPEGWGIPNLDLGGWGGGGTGLAVWIFLEKRIRLDF